VQRLRDAIDTAVSRRCNHSIVLPREQSKQSGIGINKGGSVRRNLAVIGAAAAVGIGAVAATGLANTGHHDHGDGNSLRPGNLLVSGSVYNDNPANVTIGAKLPTGPAAIASGSYPQVWNNNTVDGSFGITSPIFLDQLTPSGKPVSSIDVPNSLEPGVGAKTDQMVTSFSSKSELALNLATNGQSVAFMGYLAPVDALDVSNSNTQGVIDPTNPVTSAYYRVVAQLGKDGRFHFTLTNAYSGNNGRAAILNSSAHVLYAAGNAGNGSNPQPNGVIEGTGAQILAPADKHEAAQTPGAATAVGSFNVTQLGDAADKIGKDTNFRGMTIFHNVLYYTKGSGGNGVNTVYFVDTTGKACPTGGVGVPQPGAKLPTSPLAYNPALVATEGLTPYNMCVLKGFPTTLAKTSTAFPFGLWFANRTTLYVADEGNGTNTYSGGSYTAAAAQPAAGLQKWVFDSGTGSWKLAYTLQNGLDLGQPYTVAGYPTGTNPVTKLPWAPATDGLRNLIGRVNGHGTVTIWAVTSTVSGNGDQGADPNKLVAITDRLSASSLPAAEHFGTVDAAGYGQVLRGVSFTPGTTP